VNIERELKLIPTDPALLDQLLKLDHLGSFTVKPRAHQWQTNTFFDTAGRALDAARIGFRRRTVRDRPSATWCVKLEGSTADGVMSRPEIEVTLDADTAPLLAMSVLRQAAAERGAPLIAEQLSDALANRAPVLAKPHLEFETERDVLDLTDADRGWQTELALDRMRFLPCGHQDFEIEVELRKGDESALEAAREAITALGEVTPATVSKLGRALGHRCS
jgi:inorganic triphosphatase YgiF